MSALHGKRWRKMGDFDSSVCLLHFSFSGGRERERVETEQARVKWREFRIIDFWLSGLRMCVSVNGVGLRS